ncbi:MAG: hypothetical protein P8M30_20565 [Planctomycetaceae bacterium]|nr:hypothetical protein [Planctomycetaceae bacterium]
MTDAVGQSQFDNTLGQETKRPVRKPFGRFAEECNHEAFGHKAFA